jgi:hypothetical protein
MIFNIFIKNMVNQENFLSNFNLKNLEVINDFMIFEIFLILLKRINIHKNT